jgi:phosphatidylglycerophosphate synthase
VARRTGLSDFGGYLDIVCDFVFYAAVPLGFALADPSGNAVAGGGAARQLLSQCRQFSRLCHSGGQGAG